MLVTQLSAAELIFGIIIITCPVSSPDHQNVCTSY